MKKILLTTATTSILLCGILYLSNNSSSIGTDDTMQSFIDKTYSRAGIENVVKKIPFNTEDEMYEYASKINSLTSREEVESYLIEFMELIQLNDASRLIPYYHYTIRDAVLENLYFPAIDISDSVKFDVKDINVSDSDEIHTANVRYTLDVFSKNKKIARINRNDTFTLNKEYGRIYICGYNRSSISSEVLI